MDVVGLVKWLEQESGLHAVCMRPLCGRKMDSQR